VARAELAGPEGEEAPRLKKARETSQPENAQCEPRAKQERRGRRAHRRAAPRPAEGARSREPIRTEAQEGPTGTAQRSRRNRTRGAAPKPSPKDKGGKGTARPAGKEPGGKAAPKPSSQRSKGQGYRGPMTARCTTPKGSDTPRVPPTGVDAAIRRAAKQRPQHDPEGIQRQCETSVKLLIKIGTRVTRSLPSGGSPAAVPRSCALPQLSVFVCETIQICSSIRTHMRSL